MRFPIPLDGASAEDLEALHAITVPVEFAPEQQVFHVGDTSDGCYIIDRGVIRLECDHPSSDPDDHDDVLAFLEAGTFLGELSLLDRLPRSASAYAHTQVAARKIALSAFDDLMRTQPRIGLGLMSALGRDAALKLRTTSGRLAAFITTRREPAVDKMIATAKAAQTELLGWSEERVDGLLYAIAMAVAAQAEVLARAAVEESGIGNVPDKTLKNRVASLGVFQSMVGQVGFGPLRTGTSGVIDVRSPIGIMFGLVPVTNPTSTFVFKTLIALKARNALILSPNRKALGCSSMVGEIIHAVLEQHSAPRGLVQWIQARNSRSMVDCFMSHPEVGLVLATGGPSVVKAAYESGNPAIGVGPGNAPVLVCADASIDDVAQRVVMSKSFDNGLICGSEHNLVCVERVRASFVEALERHGAAVLSAEEGKAVAGVAIEPEGRSLKSSVIGRAAAETAARAGVTRPYPIRILVLSAGRPDDKDALSHEKMAPILSLFTVENEDHGIQVSKELLALDGMGHTAIIHTQTQELAQRFAREMPASRILVNSPGAHGVVGLTTDLAPSLTLGCGTFGNTSTTDNVTFTHLTNLKRMAYYTAERLAQLA